MKTNTEKFDDILREAFRLLREEEVLALEVAAQSLPPDQELERRIMALIYPKDKSFQTQKYEERRHSILLNIAAVLLALTISFTALLLVSPRARAYVEKIIKEIYAEYNNYRFSTQETTVEEGDYTLGYMPEGFELVEESHGENYHNYVYMTTENSLLTFNYSSASSGSLGIDNEHMIHQKIEVNGMEGTFAYSEEENFMVAFILDGGVLLSIDGDFGYDETVKILKNIESHK